MKKSRDKKRSVRLIKALAFACVMGAYLFGLLGEEKDFQEKLTKAFPDMTVIRSSGKDPVCYHASFPEGEKYLLLYKTMGWGGPALVVSKVDTSGYVEEVIVLDHKETPAFYAALIKDSYFDQFKGKYIGDNFSIDDDINAVSGATISSQGFNKALKESCHYLAETEFQMDIREDPIRISLADSGYLILLLFTLAYFGTRFGLKKLHIVVQMVTIVILGYILNYPLSVSHITSLFMGYFPSPGNNITWYILLGCIIVMLLFIGKNLYCSWICPFGAIQDLLNKVSGISLPLSPWIRKYGKISSGIIAWISVCVIFISRNPAMGNFEPFSALFSFNGFGIIWIILPVLIFSSFFIKRMWCRFFCPVGFFLNSSCRMRNDLIRNNLKKNEKRKINIHQQQFDHCA